MILGELDAKNFYDLQDDTKRVEISDDTSGTNLFSSDVPEGEERYVVALLVAETGSVANSYTIDRVDESDANHAIINSRNLASDANEILSVDDLGVCPLVVPGGENIEITAGSDGVNVTAIYVTRDR